MFRTLIVLVLAAFAAAHQELSPLYKAYQAAGAKYQQPKPILPLSVKALTQAELKNVDKSMFVAPHAGQSAVDYHPQLKVMPFNNRTITYYSWHVHVYFFHEDVNVTARTLALRDEFISHFSLATCDDSCFMGGPFDTCTQGMCVWDPVYGVDGPHPYGQWGVYMPNEYVLETVSWMSANHGEFEVLFHPNTGYMVGDHAPGKRAIWIKETVPLDLNFLIWLQCEWFSCSTADQDTLAQIQA